MLLYERLLKYYLDSDSFNVLASLFFDCYDHVGQTPNYRQVPRLRFESHIYRQISERLVSERGYDLQLSDHKIQRYFSEKYDDNQLFAIIFAEWYGLSEKQIQQIERSCSESSDWDCLNFFLCHPQMDKITAIHNDKKLLYYVQTDDGEAPATVKGNHVLWNKYGEPLLSSFEVF